MWSDIAKPVVLSALAATLSVCHEGCYQPAKSADDVYADQQMACVKKAKTLEESRSCRREVDEQWGVDGGAK